MLAVKKCVAFARGLDLRVTALAIVAEDNASISPSWMAWVTRSSEGISGVG